MAARWARTAAILIAVASLLYLAVGVTWLFTNRSPDWTDFNVHDPGLALLELLLFLSLPLLVVEAAAIHVWSPPCRKLATQVSLAFMSMFATVSAGVHFVRLTALRQLEAAGGTVSDLLLPTRWPSVAAALDFLAWDLLLGVALLFAAPAFTGGGLARAVRVGLVVSGALCLAGLLGPASGEMHLQLIATLGYAFALPATCVLLAIFFGRVQEMRAAK